MDESQRAYSMQRRKGGGGVNISRISIGRVYNLGNYEHIRYELTVDVKEGESAAAAFAAVENIIAGLKPDRISKSNEELWRERKVIEQAKQMPLAEFQRRHGDPVGGPAAYIQRLEQSLAESEKQARESHDRAKTVRRLFDDLGGASQWKGAKLDWEEYQ